MSNDIKSRAGEVVGQWDGADVSTLRTELERIKARFKTDGSKDRVTPEGIPHAQQLGELKGFTAYIIWACDRSGNCLVGSGANRFEHVDSIREFYANEIAKDASARHG